MAGNIILKYNKDENVKSISTYHIVILIKRTKETKHPNCVHVCKVYSLSVSTTFSHFMSLPKKFNFSYFILKSFSVSVSLSRLFMMLLACKNFPKSV